MKGNRLSLPLFKVYDTTTAATLNNGSDSLSALVQGYNNGGGTSDVVTLGTGSASGTFASPNVANGIAVNTSGFSISGADAGNYTLTSPTTTANITPAGLTVTATNQTQTYGFGGNSAALGTSGFTSSGLLGGQNIGSVTLATNATTSGSGNYETNAYNGNNPWTLTPSAATGGTFNANNYTITYDNASTGLTVTPKALTVSGLTASNKTYDATTADILGGSAVLAGNIAGDAVTLGGTAAGAFADPNVGNAKAVTVSGNSVSGNDANNYSFSQQAGLIADINAVQVSGGGGGGGIILPPTTPTPTPTPAPVVVTPVTPVSSAPVVALQPLPDTFVAVSETPPVIYSNPANDQGATHATITPAGYVQTAAMQVVAASNVDMQGIWDLALLGLTKTQANSQLAANIINTGTQAPPTLSRRGSSITPLYDPMYDNPDVQAPGSKVNSIAATTQDEDSKQKKEKARRVARDKLRDGLRARLRDLARAWNAMRARGQTSPRIDARPDNG